MPTIYIPSLMRNLTNGEEIINIEGKNMRQIIANLEAAYPGFRERLLEDGTERLKPNIAIMIDGRNARRILIDKVNESSEIHFLPAVSGGS